MQLLIPQQVRVYGDRGEHQQCVQAAQLHHREQPELREHQKDFHRRVNEPHRKKHESFMKHE